MPDASLQHSGPWLEELACHGPSPSSLLALRDSRIQPAVPLATLAHFPHTCGNPAHCPLSGSHGSWGGVHHRTFFR